MTPKDVIQALGKTVKCMDGEYTMTAYILRKVNGKIIHQAELQDLNGNSIIIAQLEKCEIKN